MGFLRHHAGYLLRFLQGYASFRWWERRLLCHGITIRESTLKDLDAVHQWLAPEGPPFDASCMNPNATYWVAYWYRFLAGSVVFLRYPEINTPYAGYWLSSLQIRSTLWGAGIGEKLSQMVIECARSEGVELLDLTVFADNVKAIGLYRKLGFEITPHAALDLVLEEETKKTGRRRVVMRKRLDPVPHAQ